MIVFRLVTQTVFFAIAQMISNKARTLLTCLGIIIGVWAITTVISAMTGLEGFVLKEVDKFGAQKVFVRGTRPDELDGKVPWRQIRMNMNDARMLRQHNTTLEHLTLVAGRSMPVRSKEVAKPGIEVVGIEPQWHDVERRYPIAGRPLTNIDTAEQRDVAIINDLAIDELKLEGEGVGEYIFIKDRRFLVVGVVETREFTLDFGDNQVESEIYIPFGTFEKMQRWYWPQIIGEMAGPDMADDTRAEIDFILRRARNLETDWPNTWRVNILEQQLEPIKNIALGMTVGASVLVGISLLVGGIGIMNIMLVSVSERTREIGLRKAVGANPIVILLQFLVEAVMICLVGGMIGLVLGQASTIALQTYVTTPVDMSAAEIPPWAVALALGFSASVGVIFGMWPAIKAARLDPIDALRHD